MSGADNLAMLGRGIGGLLVVLVLIALLARFARRRGSKGDGTGLRVVQRLGLSREANLAVVEVSNRTLLLGVTAQGVTMLATLDDDGHADHADRAGQPVPVAEVRPATSLVQPTQLDLSGLERDIAQPRSAQAASPVGGDRPVVRENAGGLPNGVALEEYPDLASALRAAGRTTNSKTGTTPADDAPAEAGVTSSTQQAPRTRAEARAQGALTSPSGTRTRKTRQTAPKPGELKVTRVDGATTSDGTTSDGTTSATKTSGRKTSGRKTPTSKTSAATTPAGKAPSGKAPAAGRVQASGSVLSPRTWRQGVDALRELTVRRG